MGGKTANKSAYFDKLKALLEEYITLVLRYRNTNGLLADRYKSIFIVTVDNVSSQQMHKIRKSLRGDNEVQGVVLMGKNTMVRSTGTRTTPLPMLCRLSISVVLKNANVGATSHQGFHFRLPRI